MADAEPVGTVWFCSPSSCQGTITMQLSVTGMKAEVGFAFLSSDYRTGV